ncbi:hypothetical protein CMEL01_06606 [Colletotrichum melonis]|uniref:Uncharacterized protein n=3 Tax=Colletotrichum acutatum species complex TaxID=2707335 RepID=A0AAI9XJ42_9PEZI|nr:uncharacterized protein CTAM01_00349 [Colletotrichum tamarilloi]KAK0374517.1 hypothetical protein CLIM01_08111 [Colletotrichum limetticola]KAK1452032.1 hypothetical protein CMEL01_06606 [Colletotrichum melonis]KAK1512954.1 hypothetical protein CTAM01_00349 [Colletotrichum tamarilloi]
MSTIMEPRIIPSQLPPGLEIAIPPGGELPPQQPRGTYDKKPLPPLPPLRPGFYRQVSAFSVMSAMSVTSAISIETKSTTRNSSRSRSRARTTPSPSPSRLEPTEGPETIERLENEISTILIQHSPTPLSPVSPRSEHRSCSPQSRRPEPEIRKLAVRRLSTPITSPCTLHRSSAKIKQITGLDVDFSGFTPTPPRPPRSPLVSETLMPATPDKSSSVHSTEKHSSEKPASTSEPARTLSLIDDYDDDSEPDSSEWDFSPSSRRNHPSWIPASPVPPRVEILDFDEASPRRRDSEIGCLRSPGMHHFETLPARRNNHMEVSYVGAKDLYHATATSIANSAKKTAGSSRDSMESGRSSIRPPKNRLSFAAKVLQSGRKRPPTGINTTPQSPSSLGPGTGSTMGKQSLRSLHPDMHAHSMDDDRLRVKYSDALSRVFRWSGEHRRVVSEGTTATDLPPTSEPRSTTATPVPDSPTQAGPGLKRMSSRRSMQGLAAQFKRTANSMVLTKDERRRENLRQSIRVIPEGSTLE